MSVSERLKQANEILAANGNYKIAENGDRFCIYRGDKMLSPIAVFPVSINKHVGEKNEVETHVITFYKGEKQSIIRIFGEFKKTLCSKMYEEWGPDVVPELSRKHMKAIISVLHILCGHTDVKLKYMLPSWNTDFSYYIFGNLYISGGSITEVDTELQCRKIWRGEHEESDVSKFIKDVVLNLSADKEYPITLLLFSLLDIMMPKLQNSFVNVPSFGLLIIGQTNSFKTSSVLALCNPFGVPIASFEDTEKAITQRHKTPSCGTVIIDDLNFNSAEKVKKLENVIRLVGDDTTSASKMVGNKIDNSSVRNMCIITGESQPKLRPSSIPRILIYDIDNKTINKDTLTSIQNNPDMIASIIIRIIQYCMDESIGQRMVEMMEAERLQLSKSIIDVLPRYLSIAAWLIAAWRIIIEVFPEVFLSIDYPDMIINRVRSQNQRFKDDPVALFLDAMTELIDRNEISLAEPDNPSEDADGINYTDMIFIVSGKVYNKVTTYCKNEMKIDFPCGEKLLRKELYERNILRADSVQKLTSQLRIKSFHKSGFTLYKSKIGGSIS